MIKILIVEDNEVKLGKILDTLKDEIKSNVYSTSEHDNVKSAKSKMYEEKFDLVILDLVLPIDADDDKPSSENGISFLENIYENPSINRPAHIIGLTQFSDLKPEYEHIFHKNLNHLINYQEEESRWKEELIQFVWRLIEKENEFNANRIAAYNYDVAIIAALDMELDAFKALIPSWGNVRVENDPTTYSENQINGRDGDLRIISGSAPMMGMNAASVLSMKMIYNFRPKYIIMVGIAACTRPRDEHGFGDVLVVEQAWDGGAGKVTIKDGEPLFMPSAHHLSLDSDIRENIRSIKSDQALLRQIKDEWHYNKPNTELRVHIGPVASVAGVTENPAIIEELKRHERKILGLEMESYGVFYSAANCSNPKPKAIAMKSVSDFADLEKNDKFQLYASYTSAKFTLEFIKRYL
ncbi:hypothetical protein [Pedobacter psychrodurus]|uniref:phosphorylase family protein n=1 Tax=Pedobacter psychrodurus TaxID=2530456 RepID=UPI002930E9AA|nr:hypothetical protein [Pedobacter psychrodurus]